MHRRKFLRNTAAGLGGIVAVGKPVRVAAEISASTDETAPAPGESGLRFSTGFEGGSLGKVIRVTDTYTRCILLGEVDQLGRNRQISWYYFRIDNAPPSELTIDFTDLVGEYNFRPGAQAITPDTPPVYSYDNQHWTHVSKENWTAVDSSMRLRIRPRQQRLWIAHVAPYTNRNLARLLESIKGAHGFEQQVIGKSVQGRDIPLLTITDPGRGEQQKKVVWLMFRQHAWEGGSSWAGEGAIRFLVSTDAAAARIRRETIFKVLPMQDPDGVLRGGVRFNAYGYDLNRNWDSNDPVKMPEITAARNAIVKWANQGKRIDFFLSLHNDEENEYLSPPLSPKFTTLGQKVFDELTRATTFDPSRAYDASPPKAAPPAPGRMQVNEGLYSRLHIPAFLMEQRVAAGHKLGRCPTVNDRLQFGEGLVKAICAALA